MFGLCIVYLKYIQHLKFSCNFGNPQSHHQVLLNFLVGVDMVDKAGIGGKKWISKKWLSNEANKYNAYIKHTLVQVILYETYFCVKNLNNWAVMN